ncbi:MAG: tetratricopeptide repeat protein [Candidatus Latescibacterota bacterium]|nr:tetratricopeptide repeat protein [Candidatus Latescibacterota bacterium]
MNGCLRSRLVALTALLLVSTLFSGCASRLASTSAREDKREQQHSQAMQYFVRAKVFESEGNPLGAIVALRSAADLDPSSPTIYTQLARNYDDIRDYRMSTTFAEKALELDPELTALRYQLVRWLDVLGESRRAARHVEALIERERHAWPLYSHLARLYTELGEQEKVAPLFDQILADPKTPQDVRVNIAYVLSRSGRTERSEEIFLEVLSRDPKVEDAWLGLGEMQLVRGDREAAIRSFRDGAVQVPESNLLIHELAQQMHSAIDLEPMLVVDDAGFLYRLGVALSGMEKFTLAARVFENIVGQKPKSAESWLDAARYYLHVGQIERSEEILRQAIAAMPDSVDLYLFWGTALEKEERYDEAAEFYQQALQRIPGNEELFISWGFNHEQRDQWDEAIQVYRQALRDVGELPSIYVRWGLVLGQQERWYEAVDRYRRAVLVDSTHVDAFLHWGLALQHLERWEEAVQRLDQAHDLEPLDTVVLFYLGAALERSSSLTTATFDEVVFERAVSTFRRLLELSPDDAYALNYLGYMFADRGVHLEEAVDLLSRAVTLDPDNGAFFDSLGWAYYRLGELDQAESYLAMAMEQLDDHEEEEQAVIFGHAGDIANALGKHVEATDHWQRALDLMPSDRDLQQKLRGAGAPTP